MSGGSSSSSQKQETVQSTLEGVNTGQSIQGSNNATGQTVIKAGTSQRIEAVNIDAIPEELLGGFDKLIGSVNKALDINAAGQGIIASTTAAAIDKVGERAEGATQPDLSGLSKLLPLGVLALVALVVIQVVKK